jgi:hypothetical protein
MGKFGRDGEGQNSYRNTYKLQRNTPAIEVQVCYVVEERVTSRKRDDDAAGRDQAATIRWRKLSQLASALSIPN